MRYLKTKKCSSDVIVDEDRGGVVCCGRLWLFPEARCELCGCAWGAGSVFSRVEPKR